MSLERVGTLFKIRNPKKCLMNGKLQLKPEQLEEWLKRERTAYKDKEYITIKVGLFKNERASTECYSLLEFVGEETNGVNEEQTPPEGEGDLPF